MIYNAKAARFAASRRTPPLDDATRAALVQDPPRTPDLGIRLHNAIIERQRTWRMYGRDEGKEAFLNELEKIRTEELARRNSC